MSTGTSNSFTVTANKASKLAVTMQPTGVVAGSGFSFAVSAEDSLGNIDQTFNGTVSVSLFTNPGNSTLGGNLYAQAVNGTATFTSLTLNVADPGYILQAIYSGLSATTTAAFSVAPGQASKLVMVAQPPTSVTAGTGFGFVVEALDSSGNLATGFGGTVTAVISSNPGGSTLGGNVTATVSNGVATFSGMFLNFADAGYTLQATSPGITAVTTNAVTVTAGKAMQLVATTEPASSVNAGSSITFVVAAEDHFGNIDTTFSNLVSVSLTSNPGNGTLGGTTTVGPLNGVATFNTLSLTAAGTGYVLQASSSGVTAGASTAFSVKADKATQLVLTSEPPSSVTAGAGFGFVLDAKDQYDNIDPTFAGPVLASLVNNPGGSTLGGNLQATITGGVVTFSGLTLNKADPGYTLVANSLTLSSQATSAVTVNAGTATQLVVTSQPSGVIAGQSFGFNVAAEDNFGNVATFNGTVTVALANNPGSTTLGGTLTATASQGVATFSGLKLNVADTGYTLQVTGSGLNAGATGPFTVTSGKATQLVVLMANEPPASVTAGVGFGFTVYAEDALGNIDLSFNGPVSATLASNSAGSTLGGSPSAFVSAGVAIFSGLTLNLVGTGYTLQASSPGLSSITTTAINVTPGTATQLVISSEPPASVLVDGPFGLVVKAEDSEGNVDPNYSGSITLSLLNNPGGATLGGNVTVNASAGLASFSGLTVNQAGSPDTIEATATGLVAATSTPFVAAFSVPTTTATLSGTVGTNGWYRSAVTVSLSASDPVFNVGINTFIAIDGGSFAAYSGPVKVSGDGLHTVSYYSVNSAGKQEAVETTNIEIDTVAPSTTESMTSIKGKNGFSTAVTMTLTATDATSGVEATYYTINGGQPNLYGGPTALPDGNLNVTYYSVDVAGNQETAKSFSAKVDSTPPVTTPAITGTAGLNGYYRSAVSVKLKATDNVSGVSATYYRIGTSGSFIKYQPGVTVISFTTQGSHTITYYSVDFAGNKEPVSTTTIKIDSVAPPVTITTLTPATVVSDIVTAAGTSQANTTISVVVSDTKGKTVTGTTTTDSTGHWTLNLNAGTLADGVLTATVTATDLAGNTKVVRKVTTKSSQVVMVVTMQPTTVRQNAILPSVVVQLEDGFGHVLNLFGDDVTVAVASPLNGTISGTLTQTTNLQGQAIFYDLSFSPPGTYSLVFTAAGILTIESRSFTVTS